MGWFGRKAAEPPAVFLSCLDENRNPFPSGYQAQVREVVLAHPVGRGAGRWGVGRGPARGRGRRRRRRWAGAAGGRRGGRGGWGGVWWRGGGGGVCGGGWL